MQDQNGQDRYTTEITVNEFTFLTPKSSSDQASSTSESNYDSGQSSSSPAVSDTEDEDALPF